MEAILTSEPSYRIIACGRRFFVFFENEQMPAKDDDSRLHLLAFSGYANVK